jgi:hypothetical protein
MIMLRKTRHRELSCHTPPILLPGYIFLAAYSSEKKKKIPNETYRNKCMEPGENTYPSQSGKAHIC